MTLDLDQKYQFFTGKAEIGGKTVDITDGSSTAPTSPSRSTARPITGKVYGDTIAGANWKATKASSPRFATNHQGRRPGVLLSIVPRAGQPS